MLVDPVTAVNRLDSIASVQRECQCRNIHRGNSGG